MRNLFLALTLVSGLNATSLEKLDFDEMVAKSTSIVRARIGSGQVQQHGSIFYTHYTIQISQQWKSDTRPHTDVVVPGGSLGKVQQTYAGSPKLIEGNEYVLFLWTSKSGLTHIIGLTQGLFELSSQPGGNLVLSRGPIQETQDSGLRMSMTDFDSKVRASQQRGRQ